MINDDCNYADISWSDLIISHNEEPSEFKYLESIKYNFLSQVANQPTRSKVNQTCNMSDLILVDKTDIIQDIQFVSILGDDISLNILLNCESANIASIML